MRSDKLQDALGKIDPTLIARAENKPKKSRSLKYIRLIAPVAAILALAICLGLFSGIGKNPNPNVPLITTQPNGTASVKNPNSFVYVPDEIKDTVPTYPSISGESFKPYLLSTANFPVNSSNSYAYYGAGFGMDVFFKSTVTEFLSGKGDQNAVYSPINVYFALTMLAEVTEGNTRQQILDLLGTDSIEYLRTQAHAIWNANYGNSDAFKNVFANSVWLDNNYFGDGSLNKDILDILAKSYYASSFWGDLGTDEMNKIIGECIKEQTGGHLDGTENVQLDPNTVMALVSTVYFESEWKNKFINQSTGSGVFHAPGGDTTVDFMYCETANDEYCWGVNFTAAGKDLMSGGKMWFILPNEGVDIDTLLSDREALSFMMSGSSRKSPWRNSKTGLIAMSLPKFDVQSDMSLIEGLKALGITDCFDGGLADYSSLTDKGSGIYVEEVDHSARVTVNEKGVTASASTTVGSGYKGLQKIRFVLDRPFIFVLTGADGLPLFVGVINSP